MSSPTAALLACALGPALLSAGGPTEIVRLPAWADDLDARIELVSRLVDEDETAGLGWRPNERCDDEASLARARARFTERLRERRTWLAARRREVDERVGHRVLHVRTRHFELAYDLGEHRAGRRRLRPLDGALLYATRLEDEFDFVTETFGVAPERPQGAEPRHRVYLFARSEDARRIAEEVLGNRLGGGMKSIRIGHPLSALVLWNDKGRVESDEVFHQILVHNVAHLLDHDVGPYRHWLYERHGWLYEGLAYHDTIRRFGPPVTTCRPDEADGVRHWLSPYFEANVRKAIATGRDPDPRRVFKLAVPDLRPKERQFAWSYVDFLLWRDREAMVRLLGIAKTEDVSAEEALKEACGLDLEGFRTQWRAFVRERYSRRLRQGPTPPRR